MFLDESIPFRVADTDFIFPQSHFLNYAEFLCMSFRQKRQDRLIW